MFYYLHNTANSFKLSWPFHAEITDTKLRAKTNTQGLTIAQLPGHSVLPLLAVVQQQLGVLTVPDILRIS